MLTSKKGFIVVIGIPVVLILGILLKNSVGNMREAIEEAKKETEEKLQQKSQGKSAEGTTNSLSMTEEELAAMRKRITEEVHKQLEQNNYSIDEKK